MKNKIKNQKDTPHDFTPQKEKAPIEKKIFLKIDSCCEACSEEITNEEAARLEQFDLAEIKHIKNTERNI